MKFPFTREKSSASCYQQIWSQQSNFSKKKSNFWVDPIKHDWSRHTRQILSNRTDPVKTDWSCHNRPIMWNRNNPVRRLLAESKQNSRYSWERLRSFLGESQTLKKFKRIAAKSNSRFKEKLYIRTTYYILVINNKVRITQIFNFKFIFYYYSAKLIIITRIKYVV